VELSQARVSEGRPGAAFANPVAKAGFNRYPLESRQFLPEKRWYRETHSSFCEWVFLLEILDMGGYL
jgi:hypothetical protein